MAACAARLKGSSGMVWVDLGGGTAENVDMMAEFVDLASFEKIYVVDMCSALCKVAREKMERQGRSNVEIIEGDACTFVPPKAATLVTFSYSLSSKCLPSAHTSVYMVHSVFQFQESQRNWQLNFVYGVNRQLMLLINHDESNQALRVVEGSVIDISGFRIPQSRPVRFSEI